MSSNVSSCCFADIFEEHLSSVYFCTFHTCVTSFTHFTLHFLCIYVAGAEYFFIPDNAVDRRKLLVFTF